MAVHINTKMEVALPPRTFGRGLRANKVMKKVGIIRCQQTEDLCGGSTDFMFAAKGRGAFEPLGECRVVGFVSCGGCPGKKAVTRSKMLRDHGAEVIVLASCISLGSPMGFPCPNKAMMKKAIQANLGEDMPVLDYTHPFPMPHH